MARTERDWEALAAGMGIVNVVLSFVGNFLVGTPPAADASMTAIRSYFEDHRTALLGQILLFGLGVAALLWYLGALRSYLRRHEGASGRLSATAYGAGLGIAFMLLLTLLLELGLVWRVASTADDALVRAIFDAITVGGVLFCFPIAVLMGAATLVGFRTGALPRWLCYFGALGALVNLAGASQLFVDSGPWTPGGSLAYVPFVVIGLWNIAVPVVIIARARRTPEPAVA